MTHNICSIDGCEKPARTSGSEWCAMHYHRWYRHGSTTRVDANAGITASKGRRYTMTRCPGHPLADKQGRTYTHRLVLFDAIGYGPHPCHWCGSPLTWGGQSNTSLHVDHLDGYGDHNDPSNLVPSCVGCNSTRGRQARSDLLRSVGWWSNHDTVARRRPRIIMHNAHHAP